MKKYFSFLLILTGLCACNQQENKKAVSSLPAGDSIYFDSNAVADAKIEEKQDTVVRNTDTTFLADFKNNLAFVKPGSLEKYYRFNLLQARNFIAEQEPVPVEKDSAYYKKLEKQLRRISETVYRYNEEWTIHVLGYVNGNPDYEGDDDASVVVINIYRNNELWFTDIQEDFLYGMSYRLSGFEHIDDEVILWGISGGGSREGGGKFRAIINKAGGISYQYQFYSE